MTDVFDDFFDVCIVSLWVAGALFLGTAQTGKETAGLGEEEIKR